MILFSDLPHFLFRRERKEGRSERGREWYGREERDRERRAGKEGERGREWQGREEERDGRKRKKEDKRKLLKEEGNEEVRWKEKVEGRNKNRVY